MLVLISKSALYIFSSLFTTESKFSPSIFSTALALLILDLTALSLLVIVISLDKNDKVEVITTGYGHGVGMSQYGAEGMARLGYTYDQILKYYYQGVEIKKI